MLKVLFVFGTRPEAIKLAPVIKTFSLHPEQFASKVCITSQHREMLDQVLAFFSINPDYDLGLMQPNQSLFDLTINGLVKLRAVLYDFKPDFIVVQGDTTSSFIGALAGFYYKTKIVHIEAGLRSGNKYSPFPEEINRVLTGHLADYHFAPTLRAKRNLGKEGITKHVFVVGNTGIDALYLSQRLIRNEDEANFKKLFNFVDFSKKIILVTGHRRESFGKPLENICYALRMIVDGNPETEMVYPVHLNPNVLDPVYKILNKHPRIHLIKPLSYPLMVLLMNKCYMIISDSGGIQEEAPALGKPILVTRSVTERKEGIRAGTALLVGSNKNRIIAQTERLLHDPAAYEKMSKAINPYGDGNSAKRIFEILSVVFKV